ncbi:hypothetical protein BKA65DRAFT_171829 [Rhexocercosporidium sp. MPI-PUGE-AT-0058]|nr:hypothetical protein BKA65DRAFT_171829 [Rhexocercosporidium sp. MPI-PUGE-AT-0058]
MDTVRWIKMDQDGQDGWTRMDGQRRGAQRRGWAWMGMGRKGKGWPSAMGIGMSMGMGHRTWGVGHGAEERTWAMLSSETGKVQEPTTIQIQPAPPRHRPRPMRSPLQPTALQSDPAIPGFHPIISSPLRQGNTSILLSPCSSRPARSVTFSLFLGAVGRKRTRRPPPSRIALLRIHLKTSSTPIPPYIPSLLRTTLNPLFLPLTLLSNHQSYHIISYHSISRPSPSLHQTSHSSHNQHHFDVL